MAKAESILFRDIEPTDFDLLPETQEGPEADEIISVPDMGHLYARPITVPRGATAADPITGPQSPIERRESLWTVALQAYKFAVLDSGAPAYIVAVVNYGQGQLTKQKTIVVRSMNEITFIVRARFVNVTFYTYQGDGAAQSGTGLINAAVVPGGYAGAEGYAWQWSQNVANGDDGSVNGLLQPGAGVIGYVHVILKTPQAAGTPLWPLLFDTVTGPNGRPLRGGRLDAVFNAGDGQSWSDEQAPGASAFTTGLWVALSADPYTYVAPAAGNLIVAEAKVGT